MRNPMSYSNVIMASRDESIILMKRLNPRAGLEKHSYVLELMGLKRRAYVTERQSVTAAIVAALGRTDDCSVESAESLYKVYGNLTKSVLWVAFSDRFTGGMDGMSGLTLRAIASKLSEYIPGTKGLKGTDLKVIASRYYGVDLKDGHGRLSVAIATHLQAICMVMLTNEKTTAADALNIVTALNGLPIGLSDAQTREYLKSLKTMGIKRWQSVEVATVQKCHKKISRNLHPDSNNVTREANLSRSAERAVESREAVAMSELASAKKVLLKYA